MKLEWNDHERDYCQSLIGIPYSDIGDTREGCYCVGLVCLFFRDHGMECPNPCSRIPPKVHRDLISKYFVQIEEFPKYGDIVQIVRSCGDTADHVGIYTPDGILHSHQGAGVVRARRGSQAIVMVYRHRDFLT